MKMTELKSGFLKKEFNASKARFRYHNKNKSGGNFAIELWGIDGKDYDLHGYYDIDLTITHLDFGVCMRAGHDVPSASLEEMLNYIKNILKLNKQVK